MAAKTQPKKVKRVFDVAAPGAPKLSPDTSSRSIIIKHAPVQDPMVVAKPKKATPVAETVEPTAPSAPVLASPSSKKIVIQPIHATLEESAPEEPAPDPAPEPVVEASKGPEAAPTPEPVETPKPAVEEKEEVAVNEQKPVVDDEQDAAERQATVAKLVASQEYFLPIETVEARRSKRAVIVGTLSIVLLLVAWYNVSLDAGLLPNTYNLPHTSFFSAR